MDDRLDELYGHDSPVERFEKLSDAYTDEEMMQVSANAIAIAKHLLIRLKEKDANVSRPSISRTLYGDISLLWRNHTTIVIDKTGDKLTCTSPFEGSVTSDKTTPFVGNMKLVVTKDILEPMLPRIVALVRLS
jgi:hypothetical protein